jgi:hypothetical protein
MRHEVPFEDRCPTYFDRRTRGARFVLARWQCPRKKMKGLPYCSYCEPLNKKLERLREAGTPSKYDFVVARKWRRPRKKK